MPFRLRFLISALLLLSVSPRAASLTPDGLALLSLKSAADPAGAPAFSDWNESDATPCRWTGVSCASASDVDDARVVGLSVAGKNLRGYIPSELGTLTRLRRLNLHGNDLYGSIPDHLFNASSLHSVFLYGNNLSGHLPPSLCSLTRLQNLDLSNNSLSGQLPEFLKNCGQLRRLILSQNHFSGEIPAGIFPELADLEQLDLSSNNFNGSIPDDIGELKSLSGTLNLSYNHFAGEIPKTLGNLPLTVSFDLRHNELNGKIPETGSFANQGPTAFSDNPSLCGFPLPRPCKNDSNRSPKIEDGPGENAEGFNSRKGLKPAIIILVALADAVGVAFVGLLIVYAYWKKKDSDGCSCTGNGKLGGNHNENTGFGFFPWCDFPSENSDTDSGGGGEGGLVAVDKGFEFELDELLRASAYVLGKSGLGIVYKVVLGNGVPVAVRRLGEGGGGEQRAKEFVSEVRAIARVKHPNIVRLRAYYWAPDEKLLVSDFVSNGNLAAALRGKMNHHHPSSLPWSARLKIAKGTARGLAYLHECSPRKFVHGDIKPSNILLDSDFKPYISDFGLSRLVTIAGNDPSSSGGFTGGALPYRKPPAQPDKASSSGFYYRAPEARLPGARAIQKWDVYSFGVVLLELLTGKSPDSSSPASCSSGEALDLVGWVRRGFEEERHLSEMVDPVLLGEVRAKKEVVALFRVALSCTESDPEARPRMKAVAENLDKIGH